mmetsp:Transcript_12017/g.29197  ORF Transcript_12017/g.29197 Transcript_12017/m.29197 type:complete len:235 (-) Transcript_12017:4812-5516(-)
MGSGLWAGARPGAQARARQHCEGQRRALAPRRPGAAGHPPIHRVGRKLHQASGHLERPGDRGQRPRARHPHSRVGGLRGQGRRRDALSDGQHQQLLRLHGHYLSVGPGERSAARARGPLSRVDVAPDPRGHHRPWRGLQSVVYGAGAQPGGAARVRHLCGRPRQALAPRGDCRRRQQRGVRGKQGGPGRQPLIRPRRGAWCDALLLELQARAAVRRRQDLWEGRDERGCVLLRH